MSYFPFMIDIKDADVLVVGGGKIAYRKVTDLLQFGAKITVVAPEIIDEIKAISEVTIHKREYRVEDLENRFLVIAATDLEQTNRKVSKDCKERQIMVNAVDIKEACSFIFPAIIKKNELVVSVSTGGNSPAGAAYLKDKIQAAIPRDFESNVKLLGSLRDKIAQRVPNASDRKKLYYTFLEDADKNDIKLDENFIFEYIEKNL